MIKKFLEKIEALMNDLQLAVNNQNEINGEIRKKETQLAGLIEENKNRSHSLDEKESKLAALGKKYDRITDLEAREQKYDTDLSELRRQQQLLTDQRAAHDKKAAEEKAELDRQKEKLQKQREALEDEKKSYKEKARQEIISDYLKNIPR